jgi:hypothetical protein
MGHVRDAYSEIKKILLKVRNLGHIYFFVTSMADDCQYPWCGGKTVFLTYLSGQVNDDEK